MINGSPLLTLEDPRPNASAAPYTFFLPSEAALAAVAAGDLVKLIFRAVPPSETYDAERMWVRVQRIEQDILEGALKSGPRDMPLVRPGVAMHFKRHHIIGIQWRIPLFKPKSGPAREYWERCLVDDCVLYDNMPIGYLYREKPDLAKKGDRYPDSGWRIRGDYRDCPGEEVDARKMSYVALGAVLNRDDSWLSLIDEPVGSAFLRDFDTGGYIPEGR